MYVWFLPVLHIRCTPSPHWTNTHTHTHTTLHVHTFHVGQIHIHTSYILVCVFYLGDGINIYMTIKLTMWQSRVKIEHYSVAYFARIAVFEVL